MTAGAKGAKGPEVAILRLLAGLGAGQTPVTITSREIGERTGTSQQAADRHLVALAKRALITRQLAARRQRITLAPAAMEILRAEYRAVPVGSSRDPGGSPSRGRSLRASARVGTTSASRGTWSNSPND